MKLRQALTEWERDHPDYHMYAGDHVYGCICAHCITFHALLGLDIIPEEPVPEWEALADEAVRGNDLAKLYLSDDQAARFMSLVDQYL